MSSFWGRRCGNQAAGPILWGPGLSELHSSAALGLPCVPWQALVSLTKDSSGTQGRGNTPCPRIASCPQVELLCGPITRRKVSLAFLESAPCSALELGLNPGLLVMISDSALCLSPSGPAWILGPWSQLSPVDSWFLHSPDTITCSKVLLCSPIPTPDSRPRPLWATLTHRGPGPGTDPEIGYRATMKHKISFYHLIKTSTYSDTIF